MDSYLREDEEKKTRGEPDKLTNREKEVLQLIAEGYTNNEIGNLMNISVKTVETHRAHIMSKLDIHDTAGLVKYAIRKGVRGAGPWPLRAGTGNRKSRKAACAVLLKSPALNLREKKLWIPRNNFSGDFFWFLTLKLRLIRINFLIFYRLPFFFNKKFPLYFPALASRAILTCIRQSSDWSVRYACCNYKSLKYQVFVYFVLRCFIFMLYIIDLSF